jgi:hypothetical protein
MTFYGATRAWEMSAGRWMETDCAGINQGLREMYGFRSNCDTDLRIVQRRDTLVK